MKLISVVVILFFFTLTISAQVSFWGIEVSPNMTIPLGNVNHKFWNYPEDSNLTTKRIISKKTPGAGLTIAPMFKKVFKPKKAVSFSMAVGLGYYLKRYNISWVSEYESSSAPNGIISIAYKIERHELGLQLLPGLTYKGLSVEAGINMLGLIESYTNIDFIRNNIVYKSYRTNDRYSVKSGAGRIMNFSLPIRIAYTINVHRGLYLEPLLAYEFGFADMDLYALGNVNRANYTFLSEVKLGLNIYMPVKSSAK